MSRTALFNLIHKINRSELRLRSLIESGSPKCVIELERNNLRRLLNRERMEIAKDMRLEAA